MIDQKIQKFEKRDKVIIISLGIFALVVTVLEAIGASRLFTAFFIRDDYIYLDMAPLIRQDPSILLTATCIGWWRPLSALIPNLIYFAYGLNPLPYHLLAFLIHLMTGFMLLLLSKKLFDIKIGLVAYVVYITAPISMSNTGWMLGAFSDEIATFFFLLTLLTQLRSNPDKTTGPYFLAAFILVIGSFFKITWVALIPVVVLMDWVNYKRSRFWKRLLRLSPFVIAIPVLFLNFVIIGFNELGGSIKPLFLDFFTGKNLTLGATLPFLRFHHFLDENHNLYLRLVFLFPILIAALLLSKNQRMRVLLLIVAFFSMLLLLGFNPLYNEPWGWVMGWLHMTPLVAFASILLAIIIVKAVEKIKPGYFGWLAAVIVSSLIIWSGAAFKEILYEEVESDQSMYSQYIHSYLNLIEGFPKDSEVFILDKKIIAINLFDDISGLDCNVILVVRSNRRINYVHNYDRNSENIVVGEDAYIYDYLKQKMENPKAKVIRFENDNWNDISSHLR